MSKATLNTTGLSVMVEEGPLVVRILVDLSLERFHRVEIVLRIPQIRDYFYLTYYPLCKSSKPQLTVFPSRDLDGIVSSWQSCPPWGEAQAAVAASYWDDDALGEKQAQPVPMASLPVMLVLSDFRGYLSKSLGDEPDGEWTTGVRSALLKRLDGQIKELVRSWRWVGAAV